MSIDLRYDPAFNPPAPVVRLRVGALGAGAREELDALIDTGADVSVLPQPVVRRLALPLAGLVTARSLGPPRQVSLYTVVIGIIGGPPEEPELAISWDQPFALLGRLLLNRVRIVLDGPGQRLSIE